MKSWYSVKNIAQNKADISIHDEIGYWGVSARDFIEELNGLDDVKEISLSIHSPGGSVFDGLAIYNALLKHPATVNVQVLGLAASAASFIAMAGDTIDVPVAAEMMIHNAWSFATGNADDMEEEAKFLRHIDNTIVSVYHARTGLDEQEIRALMAEEKWMNGQQAHELGFCDTCSELKAAACAKAWNRCFKTKPSLMDAKIAFSDWKDFSNWLSKLTNLSGSEREQVVFAVKQMAQSKSEPSNETNPDDELDFSNIFSILERCLQ